MHWVYSLLLFIELLFFVVLIFPTYPILIKKMYKGHRYEFKVHGPGFMVYTFTMIVTKLVNLEEYLFLFHHLFITNHQQFRIVHLDKLPSRSFMAAQMLDIPGVLLMLVLVVFKKDQDLFMSFSKIDSQA